MRIPVKHKTIERRSTVYPKSRSEIWQNRIVWLFILIASIMFWTELLK